MLCAEGWDVVGVDNDMRSQFFGSLGTTRPVVAELTRTLAGYRHHDLDIRDRQKVRDLLDAERPDFIIHTAAQPSHDKAASIPYDDFDVNAGGTMNMLVAARDFCHDSPFCFTSTNKVYGDRPNYHSTQFLPVAITLSRRCSALLPSILKQSSVSAAISI
jgi:CDP-paratose 2-epimerase